MNSRINPRALTNAASHTYLLFRRRRTINELEVLRRLRVFWPFAGLPQGETGCLPFVRPSPVRLGYALEFQLDRGFFISNEKNQKNSFGRKKIIRPENISGKFSDFLRNSSKSKGKIVMDT